MCRWAVKALNIKAAAKRKNGRFRLKFAILQKCTNSQMLYYGSSSFVHTVHVVVKHGVSKRCEHVILCQLLQKFIS
jgi:hypothetical protein